MFTVVEIKKRTKLEVGLEQTSDEVSTDITSKGWI
jgi:hypothetical protein